MIIKKINISIAIVTFSLAFSATSILAMGIPSAPEASPDVYKIIAENEQFRVIEATWKPGQEDNYHYHPADRVSLYPINCKLRLSKPDGSYKDVTPKAGSAKVRTGKPVTSHKAKNIGDKTCVLRIIELK